MRELILIVSGLACAGLAAWVLKDLADGVWRRRLERGRKNSEFLETFQKRVGGP